MHCSSAYAPAASNVAKVTLRLSWRFGRRESAPPSNPSALPSLCYPHLILPAPLLFVTRCPTSVSGSLAGPGFLPHGSHVASPKVPAFLEGQWPDTLLGYSKAVCLGLITPPCFTSTSQHSRALLTRFFHSHDHHPFTRSLLSPPGRLLAPVCSVVPSPPAIPSPC